MAESKTVMIAQALNLEPRAVADGATAPSGAVAMDGRAVLPSNGFVMTIREREQGTVGAQGTASNGFCLHRAGAQSAVSTSTFTNTNDGTSNSFQASVFEPCIREVTEYTFQIPALNESIYKGYYDASLCRFISADGIMSTGQGVLGYNMYAYCMNNPANLGDSDGTRPSVMMTDGGGYGGLGPSDYTRSKRAEITAIIEGNSYYSRDTFKNADEEGRKRIAQSLFDEVCGVLGVCPDLVFGDTGKPRWAGTYDHSEGKVTLHNNRFGSHNDYTVLGTVLHEVYHCYQHLVVDGAIEHGESAATVAAWKNNFSNPIESPYNAYYNQLTEVSANWFAGMLNKTYDIGAFPRYYDDPYPNTMFVGNW